jgi:UDP-glucuronate decarboxylase
MLLMASNVSVPVNIGNPTEHTIEEFAVMIRGLVGSESEIKELAAVEDDPQRRKPDITRAQTLLGWEPKVSEKALVQKNEFKLGIECYVKVSLFSMFRNLC